MGIIKHQNMNKNVALLPTLSIDFSLEKPPSKVKPDQVDSSSLISFQELMRALRSLKNIYESLIPRHLSLKETLKNAIEPIQLGRAASLNQGSASRLQLSEGQEGVEDDLVNNLKEESNTTTPFINSQPTHR